MAVQSQSPWQRGRVVAADYVADGVRQIVLEVERPEHAAPGTHIDVELDIHGQPQVRSYSVVRSEDGGRRLTLGVQLSPNSRGGSKTMHALAVGDELTVTGPLQNFPLAVGAGRYVLVAGGIGITALVAMASALRRRGADYELVFVGRSRRVMAYLDQLSAEHGDRLRVHVDDEGTPLSVPDLVADIAAAPNAATTELYMCGPIGLMNAIKSSWTEHALPEANLRFETFGSSGRFDAEEFLVRLRSTTARSWWHRHRSWTPCTRPGSTRCRTAARVSAGSAWPRSSRWTAPSTTATYSSAKRRNSAARTCVSAFPARSPKKPVIVLPSPSTSPDPAYRIPHFWDAP